ncbi:MAG TPA: hypothetical protein VGD05_06220 [Pyrinomonadaceae bacterium]
MKVVLILAWLAAIGGVAFGLLILVGGMTTAQGAPQEAVVICLALACAILPYCAARALTEISNISSK